MSRPMSNGDLQPCCGNLSRGRNWWPCYAVSCRRRGLPRRSVFRKRMRFAGSKALTAFARDDAEAARGDHPDLCRRERGPCRNLAPGRARRRCGRFACDRSQNGADLHVAGRGGARCGIAPSGAFGRFCGRGFAQRSARCSGKGRRNCPGGKKRVSLRPLIPAGGVFRQEAVRSHHARTGSCRGSDASVPDDAGEGASPKRSVAGSLCGRLRFF